METGADDSLKDHTGVFHVLTNCEPVCPIKTNQCRPAAPRQSFMSVGSTKDSFIGLFDTLNDS